ncbi:MAG TPA: arginine--tRNA ligase, partial [Desulfobacterales bacterium]|nr:arginine--tRNA ligase [Desulfobacterales bacterium]
MRKKLADLLHKTVAHCFEKGLLKKASLPEFAVEIPNNPEHGHYATNLAMTLASSQKRSPREIASIIVDQFNDDEGLIEKLEVAGPGFINFTIATTKWQDYLVSLLRAGEEFGKSEIGKGQKVMVEFVSANPTGPLHLGHGRGAALGDTLSRILRFCGYEVGREFYINDAGQQVQLLGESIYSRWRQMNDPDYPFPENGYHGDYVLELARDISAQYDLKAIPRDEAIELCASEGKKRMLEEIQADLDRFRVHFDVWYSEKELMESGKLQKTLDALRSCGHIYEHEGALW